MRTSKCQSGSNYTLISTAGAVADREVCFPPSGALVYVNGVRTSLRGAEQEAAALARDSGRPVYLVYNPTSGTAGDVLESTLDTLDAASVLHKSPETAQLANLMEQSALAAEHDPSQARQFVGYSQGSILLRNASVVAGARLQRRFVAEALAEGHDPATALRLGHARAERAMWRLPCVAAASATYLWPPFANVRHVVNAFDPIAMGIGGGALRAKDANAVQLRDGWTRSNALGHSFTEVYSPHVTQALRRPEGGARDGRATRVK